MQYVCDLEVHSKYARAVSQNMVVPEIAHWAQWKGIQVVGTGDFTHPVWLAELKQQLTEDGSGLLRLKDDNLANRPRFVLTGEVSLIYSQDRRVRRVHIIIVAPSFAIVETINSKLASRGALSSDGRPVLGLPAKWLLEYILGINRQHNLIDNPTDPDFQQRPGAYLIPAHVWTPWFGLYGSKSGFDSLEECFEELTPYIHAIETGLSSDLPMNWRLSANDKVALVSFSDAHSAPNLMREATVVEVAELSYGAISQALQNPIASGPNHIVHTLEFFPEEGKYHYDGIAAKKLRLTPAETEKLRHTNPAAAKKVTVGVLSRAEELADRPVGYQPINRPGSISVIPLQEIIADTYGVGKGSKKVQAAYQQAINYQTEYDILVRTPIDKLSPFLDQAIVNGVAAARRGEVDIEPGYDGIFGVIKLRNKKSPIQQLDLLG